MAKQNGFKVGEIVKLKSGGPEMTVQKVFDDQTYRCQWFAGKKLDNGVFPVESLQAVKPEAK